MAENSGATGTSKAKSIAEGLPMVAPYLDYSDAICAAVPAELYDWRPSGKDEGYYFSLGELVQHIADTRLQFARQLAGSDSEEGFWNTAYEDAHKPWTFRSGSREEILASLKANRETLWAFF